ncbi:MAG: peptidoglycan-binding protein LysM [Rhodothermales bacterium]|nr:peptidoglycan-binding protein LysM [Rhodothermales bacterium]
MGLFDFLKNIGKDVKKGNEGPEIERNIQTALGGQVENLNVYHKDGTVWLSGSVTSRAAKQKAVLLAGNIKGVEKVNDDGLVVLKETDDEPEFTFYEIQSGDSLSKIAREHYGDANKWNALFEANREVIEDPDLIYPGQKIRVPKEA